MTKRSNRPHGFRTRAIHHAYDPADHLGSVSPPVFMTSTYAFANVAESEQVMAEERDGYLYGRERNPTQALLEARLAELEGAEACVVTASGMAAIGSLFLSLLSQGDELVIHPTVYSNTVSVTGNALPRFGIRVVKADMRDLDALAAAIGPRTKLVYMETPINPTAEVLDIAAVAQVVHARGARLVVDSTFASPAVQRPIEHGADIVVHSLTKYINGHGDLPGGAVLGDEAGAVDRTGHEDGLGQHLGPPGPAGHDRHPGQAGVGGPTGRRVDEVVSTVPVGAPDPPGPAGGDHGTVGAGREHQ